MKLKILSVMIMVALIGSFSSCKKKGCTDPASLTYNPQAEKEDESCEYTSISITSVKKALVFKTTATWCPYCGDWGTTYSNNIMNEYQDAVVIQLHKTDEFSTNPGDEIRNVLTTGSVPHFFVGTEDIENNYNLISSAVSSELAESVEISMGLQTSTSGTTMNVKVAAQRGSGEEGFTPGDYYLAVYVLEDGQVAEQDIIGQPNDPNFVHNHVLRAEASNSGFGKNITFVGNVIEEEFNISLESSWVPANCYPVAVIWKSNPSTFEFVNLTY